MIMFLHRRFCSLLLAITVLSVADLTAQGITPKFMDPTEELDGNATKKKSHPRVAATLTPLPSSSSGTSTNRSGSQGVTFLERFGNTLQSYFPSSLTAVYTEIGSDVTSAIHYRDSLGEAGHALGESAGNQLRVPDG